MKTPAKTRKRVKRDRTAVLLRVDPKIAEWFQQAADKQRRSRTNLMELWLSLLPEILEDMKLFDSQGMSPYKAFEVFGVELGYKLIGMGVANDVILQAKEWHEEEQKNRLRQIELSEKHRGGV